MCQLSEAGLFDDGQNGGLIVTYVFFVILVAESYF